jgi:hypothetical protein
LGFFNGFSLAGDIELGALSDEPSTFLLDNRREFPQFFHAFLIA